MKAAAISVVLDDFKNIWENDGENFGLYENFLLKYLGMETILLFAKGVYSKNTCDEFQNLSEGKWALLALLISEGGSWSLGQRISKKLKREV